MTNGNSAEMLRFEKWYSQREQHDSGLIETWQHTWEGWQARAALSICADGDEYKRGYKAGRHAGFEDSHTWDEERRADGGKGEAVVALHVKKNGTSFVHTFQTLKYGVLQEGVHNLFAVPQASEGEILGHALYEALCDEFDESEVAPQAECAPRAATPVEIEAARMTNGSFHIQARAIKCGFKYWRASDAHGVTSSIAEAEALLADLLGVEVEIGGDPASSVTAPRATNAPFGNCQFRECDLPGQCLGEGKCHHPVSKRADAEKDAALTDDLRKFLDVAAGQGYQFDGVDADDLYLRLFPNAFDDANKEK